MAPPSLPPDGLDGSAPVGAGPVQAEIRRLLRRQTQALRAGNSALSALLGTACDRLAGELSSRRGLPSDASRELADLGPLTRRPGFRETQADLGDFAR